MNNNINNFSNTYVNVNTDPNAYKSDYQILDEIKILKNKIKRNKELLKTSNINEKILIENQIDEDIIRVKALYRTIENRESSNRYTFIFIFCMLILVLLFFLFSIYLIFFKY